MKKVLIIGLGLSILLISGVFLAVAAPPDQARNDDIRLRVFVHNPKPVTIAGCSQTTNDYVNDYGLAGWHLPVGGVKYRINYDSVPTPLRANIQPTIQNAFATWTSTSSSKVFVYDGSTGTKTAKLDGQNIVAWRGIQGSAIAVTYVWYYASGQLAGQLAEVDTLFNKNLQWSINNPANGDCGGVAGTYDVQNIATHEFGHWVGLDDLYSDTDKDLTMYGYGTTQELKKDSLGLGDKTGASAVSP